MEKEIIGNILNKRIAEMGYTQQEFADMMGMNKETLRSYMNGNSAYSYVLLMEFAEKLDCSYDYLLGYSKSPKREYHEVTEQTRLSEEAIRKITNYAKCYDENFEARRYIKLLNLLICEEDTLESILNYLYASKAISNYMRPYIDIIHMLIDQNSMNKQIGKVARKNMSLDEQQLVEVVSALKDLKASVSPELIAELKELDILTDNSEARQLVEILSTLRGS